MGGRQGGSRRFDLRSYTCMHHTDGRPSVDRGGDADGDGGSKGKFYLKFYTSTGGQGRSIRAWACERSAGACALPERMAGNRELAATALDIPPLVPLGTPTGPPSCVCGVLSRIFRPRDDHRLAWTLLARNGGADTVEERRPSKCHIRRACGGLPGRLGPWWRHFGRSAHAGQPSACSGPSRCRRRHRVDIRGIVTESSQFFDGHDRTGNGRDGYCRERAHDRSARKGCRRPIHARAAFLLRAWRLF
mmetsp:Transcript_15145/g.39902  ORF Transcript_15145/g.39902 Transcript_15145/m.39902 type:complete len:247 (-) Transcript_15145:826-1566(-)